MKTLWVANILILFSIKVFSQNSTEPKLLWSANISLKTPESVIYSKTCDCLIVSCINGVPTNAKDGDGYLAKVSLSGQIINEKWVTGLNAPKGSGIANGRLYVADINEIIEIDLKTGKILKNIPVQGATFINDLYAEHDGTLYFTDSDQFKAYMYQNGQITELFRSDELARINGVIKIGKHLYFSSSKSGNVARYDLKTKNLEIIGKEIPTGDGIKPYKKGFLVTAWSGELFFLDHNKNKTLLLETKTQKKNAADFEFLPKKKIIFIPTFNGNSVDAYQL